MIEIPHGSRHCEPAICITFSWKHGHSLFNAGKADKSVRVRAGSQETLSAKQDTATAYAPGKERAGRQLIPGAFVSRIFNVFRNFLKTFNNRIRPFTCKNPLDFQTESRGDFFSLKVYSCFENGEIRAIAECVFCRTFAPLPRTGFCILRKS